MMKDHHKKNGERAGLSVLMELRRKLCELARRRAPTQEMDIKRRLRALPTPDAPKGLLAKLEGDMITFYGQRGTLAHRRSTIISRVAAGAAVLLVMMTVALACVLVADLAHRDSSAGEEVRNAMTTLYPKCARCFHDSAMPKGPIETKL